MAMMNRISAGVGISVGAPAQVAAAPAPQIGNGAATPGAGIQQLTLAGNNFAATPEAPSAMPQASSAYADARERARLATQRARASNTFAGAPEVLDANTDPAPGGAGADTAGNPQ